MTKTIRNLIAAMLLIGASHGAMAGFQTGNSLLAQCESENPVEQSGCFHYLQAVIDTWDTAAAGKGFESDLCMSKGVTGGQLQKIWIKYVNDNPENLHFGAAGLVLDSYHKAFPCD
tara:strand:- start:80 stop:427 length:348 start_codon:yes stop_codon:yes gene_type:complete